MALKLGARPLDLNVVLTADTSFSAGFRTLDGSNWPGGIVVSLVFYNLAGLVLATWNASVVNDVCSWNQNVVAVNALLALSPDRVRLVYTPNGNTDVYLWAEGRL